MQEVQSLAHNGMPPGHLCPNCKASIVVQSVDLTLNTTPKNTILKAALSSEQRSIISSNAWLDDALIDMGQSLLKAKYEHINGLQSVVLVET